MVVGLQGEKFARQLSLDRMDVMVVKNLADAFIEKHGTVAYLPDRSGQYAPVTLDYSRYNDEFLKSQNMSRPERRRIKRMFDKHH